MHRQHETRTIRAAVMAVALVIGASSVSAAPPVEEELPDGQTGRLRGSVAPSAQAQGRQGVATGAGAAAGATGHAVGLDKLALVKVEDAPPPKVMRSP